MDIAGKTALVTGGASGLGEATVRALISAGANIVIVDLNDERGKALASELGERALYKRTDVTREADVVAATLAAKETFGGLHIAVNCAGIAPPATILNRDGAVNPLGHFAKIIQVNLVGSFNILASAAALMAANQPGEDGERGVVINTASIAAFDGQIGQTAYAASKGGIVGLTLPAARELARSGIRVNTIAPGLVHTPLFDSLPEKAVESLVAITQFPKRLGKPQEFAKLASHLIENAYINGETIRMDAAVRMPPK